MAKNENATVEIDSIANIARKMTPEELDGYIHTRFANDLQFFSRIVNEINESHKIRKNDPRIKLLLGDIESFYNDLIADGHIKKDLSLLDVDKIKNMQAGQSREEYVELIHEAMVHTEADYIDVFRKLNRAYVNNYECLIDEHLILTAQKILGKEIMDKGKVLNIVKTYRKEKYSNLFKSLIPQIRNSIQHQNYLIDPKQPRITFYDKRKKPLSLTLNEYKDVCRRNLCLICAFDVAYFDLATNLLKVLLETVDVVDEYLKKHKLMLSPSNKEKGVSIADLALLIKSSKFG